MTRVESVLEYEVIPLSEFDRTRPVTVVMEMNDGYYVLLDTKTIGNKGLLDPLDDYITITEYDNVVDFIKEEFDCESDDEALEIINNDDDNIEMMIEGGVIELKTLTGLYRDPEKLWCTCFGSDE